WRYGADDTENCVMIHRPFCASNFTIGSPSLFASQPVPKPCQMELPAFGQPGRSAPVVLSNAAKSRFTHCTSCAVPTARVVTGCVQQWAKLGVIPRSTPLT